MGLRSTCRYTETVTFESAREITEPELTSIAERGGLKKNAEPLPRDGQAKTLNAKALRVESTYHIDKDIDGDHEKENAYLRLEQTNPAGARQLLGRYVTTTIKFHSGIPCGRHHGRRDSGISVRDGTKWVEEPVATVTLPQYSFSYGEHIFVGDLTGDGILDIVLLRDDLNREGWPLEKPVLKGALILAGKEKKETPQHPESPDPTIVVQ